MSGPPGRRQVSAVVERQSALVGRYETWLAPDRSSPRASRRFVRANLAEPTGTDGWVDTAELLVSELVTNALLHARTGIGAAINVFVDAVRVARHCLTGLPPGQLHLVRRRCDRRPHGRVPANGEDGGRDTLRR